MQRIAPCLWFDSQAEEATHFYTSIFRNSRITGVTRYTEGTPGPVGSIMTVGFELDGQAYTALNGGPLFHFTEAISLMVNCETQDEIDHYWEKLGAGGEYVHCGWLKDKFGVSWQIVPAILPKLMQDEDPSRAQRVMAAVLKMIKLDIQKLKDA